jgi:EpsI family protein
MGTRTEPLTYWFTLRDKAVQGTTQKKLEDLRYGLTGRIPDGMLFRVSSIDRDEVRADEWQDQFVNRLPQAVSSVRTQAPERSWRSLIQAVWSVSDRTMFFQNQSIN